jgi:hypothetical protein
MLELWKQHGMFMNIGKCVVCGAIIANLSVGHLCPDDKAKVKPRFVPEWSRVITLNATTNTTATAAVFYELPSAAFYSNMELAQLKNPSRPPDSIHENILKPGSPNERSS